MRSLALWLLALMSAGLLAGPQLWGQEQANREAVAFAEGVQSTKVALIRGLSASARHGEPIAVTFARPHGVLQPSVCTVRRETFRNVMVDPITSDDALAAAHAPRAAMQ